MGKESLELQKRKATDEEMKAYYDSLNYHKLVEFDESVMNTIDEFILKHFN